VTCVRCGSSGLIEQHHVAGRLISSAEVPLCVGCHHEHHNRLRGLRYDRPGDVLVTGPVGLVELGLRRLVVLLGDLGSPSWQPLALSHLADLLTVDLVPAGEEEA
jgi:hypothetical protein